MKRIDFLLDKKIEFNDKMMRELGLDITEEDLIYDIEEETILQIKEKFIKYCEYRYPMLKPNEMDLNLIENSRLAETLSYMFFNRYCLRHGYEISSLTHSTIPGSNRGRFIITYKNNGIMQSKESDAFENESLRIFNLICILNGSQSMYDFKSFDIPADEFKKLRE